MCSICCAKSVPRSVFGTAPFRGLPTEGRPKRAVWATKALMAYLQHTGLDQSTAAWPRSFAESNDAGASAGHGGRFSDGGEKRKRPCVRDSGARWGSQVVKIGPEPSTTVRRIACVTSAR